MLNQYLHHVFNRFDTRVFNEMTIVIPTYNRPKYLCGLLEYYVSLNLPFKLLVLDSSSEQNKQNNIHCAQKHGDKVKYCNYSSDISVPEKLYQGIIQVQTKYVALCADDDLVFVKGIYEAIQFLDKNSSYVCVDGIYLNFHKYQNDIRLFIEYASSGIEAEDAGARVFRLFQAYESLFYGVYNTQNLVKIFNGVRKNQSLHYQELFQSVSTLLIGKSQRLPIFYAGRRHCEPADPVRNNWQTYYWFADNASEFINHYLQYRENLWDFYQSNIMDLIYTKDQFYQILDISHAVYFGKGCPEEYFFNRLKQYFIDDVYKKIDCKNNKLKTQLKYKSIKKEFMNYAELINKIKFYFQRSIPLKKLIKFDKNIQKKINQAWSCKILDLDNQWLINHQDFQNTYLELCEYIKIQGE